MKIRWLTLLTLTLLPGGFAARAEDPPRVQLRSLEPSPRTAHGDLPKHVYGGRPLEFTLGVEAPLATHLRVYADLLQTASGRMAAPLQRDVPVTPELAFDDRTYRSITCTLPVLPAVERKTTMLLKLRTARDPADSTGESSLTLIVYPPEEPDAWKKTLAARLTHGGWRRLAVFGETLTLRQFLRSRRVAFDDLGEDWPDEFDRRTFYVGATRAPVPPRFGDFPGVCVVLFTVPDAAAPLPPGIFQTADAAGGSLFKVTVPDLLADLGNDPGAQETLAEIFRRALEPHVHATNETTSDQTPTP